ncbi:hypothetical protein ACFFJI_10455 [Allobacillus sp. GCM10007491]|uniref:Uncharacterized protein n=1 Tax=Allobacillus saliphilus TaxID=2912308 RepID=A0A941CSY0_9BACI|nr:hypothetical protein [Allobacillus saliphilus]MBR7552644.1 hypothetical protein [Allobacillus saliphilus]
MNQLIKIVSIALAAFIVSYLVAGAVDRFGFDTSKWYVGGVVVLITVILIFGVLNITNRYVLKRAK